MKEYKAVTFKSPKPGRYRDDPLACATEENSLLYSPTVGEESISEGGHLLRCYRKNRALCVVVVLAVAIGIVVVNRGVLCEEFSSPSLVTMDLTDLPLLGAPRHDHGAHEKRGRGAHHKHHSLGRHHERIEGRGRHHDRRESRHERIGGHAHHHHDASEERSPGRHHHHRASDRKERASESVDDERSEGRDRGPEEASEEEDLVSGSVDQEELPSDSVDPEDGSVDPEEDSADPDERSGRRHHRHHKRGRHKRRRSVRGKAEDEEDEVLSCDELMIGVFEQECIAAVGTSQGTFASAPTGDGGLVGIGLGGRRMSKFSIGNVDLELQSVSLEGVNNSEDGLPVFHTPQAPAAPEAPAAPADGTAIAVDDGPEDNQGEEDPEADQGEEGDSEEDSEDDDEPGYCMRTVTTSSEPGWISETSIAKYNEMGHDNSKIFWTWGGNTAVCSFKKLEGRDCRRALDKITRSFKRDETVDLGAFSHRDLC